MAEFRIGSGEDNYIAVGVLSRQNPGSADYYDGNWVNAEVELAAGGFRGSLSGYLFADEFPRFREGLQALYENLKGVAEYSTVEGWLSIKITGDGRGGLLLEAAVLDEPGTGNTLTFSFDIDQTYLPGVIRGLDSIIEEFPVTGSR